MDIMARMLVMIVAILLIAIVYETIQEFKDKN